jgi:four helix bundle protein
MIMRLKPELRSRTKRFASEVIAAYIKLPRSREEVRVLGHQLLRSGTSVAGHAREASRARSDAEFCSKIGGLLQEADESQLWLELLEENCGIATALVRPLWTEADELIAIFTTILHHAKRNANDPDADA